MLNLTWPRKSEQQADENARLSSAVKHNKKRKKKQKKKKGKVGKSRLKEAAAFL